MEKPLLPLGTKIVAWIMVIIVGGSLIYFMGMMMILGPTGGIVGGPPTGLYMFIVFSPFILFLFLPGLLLLITRKKWAWYYALISLCFSSLYSSFLFFLFHWSKFLLMIWLLFAFFLFFLLIGDRKRFFKIAR